MPAKDVSDAVAKSCNILAALIVLYGPGAL